MDIRVERLRRLSRRSNETWQGALVKLPAWVDDEENKPYRPWAGVWLSLKTRVFHTTELKGPEEKSFEQVLNGLVELACDRRLAGYRPGKVEVSDNALAEYLRPFLSEAGIEIEVRKKLLILEKTLTEMGEHLAGRPLPAGALEAKGVTREAMRAFADAACQLYRARPWDYLTNEDLIEVESPFVDPAVRYLSVLGNGGMVYGLGFYEDAGQFNKLLELDSGGSPSSFSVDKRWTVLFCDITEIPFDDADLWEDYNLPVAGEDAYPLAICYQKNSKMRRPGPDLLGYFEGLMRALAVSSEEQIDTGRWKKKVSTFTSEMNFVLSLPGLLEDADAASPGRSRKMAALPDFRAMERQQADIHRLLAERDFENTDEISDYLNTNIVGKDIPHLPARSALEQAQDIIYEAFECRGRKRIQLARRALEICPDCADGYVIVAEGCGDVQKAAELYAKGVAAGERTLGKEFFEEQVGYFWAILETRPYMRARFGLAECLEGMGRHAEAAEHYRQMLRLNPNDNQGARYSLLACLLTMDADSQAQKLLKRYEDDYAFATWCYGRALLSFKRRGDSAAARRHLEKALEVNEYVPDYLLGHEEISSLPSGYSVGSHQEAIICADLLGEAWDRAPGALEWLESQVYVKD